MDRNTAFVIEEVVRALPNSERLIREVAERAVVERDAKTKRLRKVGRWNRQTGKPGVNRHDIAERYGHIVRDGDAPTVEALQAWFQWVASEDIELLLDDAEEHGLITSWRDAPMRTQVPGPRALGIRGAFVCSGCGGEMGVSNPKQGRFCLECARERARLKAAERRKRARST